MADFHRIRRGDYVRIRLDGGNDDWTPAFVALASDSDTERSSVILMLDGMVRATAGFIGHALPLTIDYEAEKVVSLFGDSYEMEVTDADASR